MEKKKEKNAQPLIPIAHIILHPTRTHQYPHTQT